MPELPPTHPSLLVRIRDAGDAQAWAQFVDVYAPLVYGFLRKQGLQDADAADLTQDVLRAVAGAAARLDYDPARGSFRAWLFTVVRNRLRDFLDSRKRHCRGTGDSDAQERLEQHPDPEADLSARWEQDYEWQLLMWAAEQVRPTVQPSTWQAFWQTTVECKSGQEAAEALGMSVAAVYLARGRVMARLKELVRQVQGD